MTPKPLECCTTPYLAYVLRPCSLFNHHLLYTFIRDIRTLLQIRRFAHLRSASCSMQGLSPPRRSAHATPSRYLALGVMHSPGPKKLRWAVIGITTLASSATKTPAFLPDPNYPFGILKGRDTRELVKAAGAPAARPRTLTAPPASLPSAPPCPACWRPCKSLHKHKHACITNTSTHAS
jgi:hypothetical protein